MYRSRVLLGSLAASTAMICVLSLSSPAVSAEGGFFDRPLTQAQCCFTGNSRDLIADGAGHPFLISDGGRAMDRISPRIKAPGLKLAELKADDRPITAATVSWQTVGTLTYARTNSSEHKALLHSTISGNDTAGRAPNLILDNTAVAAGTEPVDPKAPENDASAKADTPEKPNDTEAGATAGEFSGSPQPAGPDLTASEEKDLISSGWK